MVARSGLVQTADPKPAMSVFKNGKFYHYEFKLDGRRRRGSTGTANKQQAIAEERRQRERLEKSYSQVIEEEARDQRRKTIQFAADEFLPDEHATDQCSGDQYFRSYPVELSAKLPERERAERADGRADRCRTHDGRA